MEHFDYVVVGAGSAGCVLASRLSEDGAARVLLLEAGPRDAHPAVHVPAAFPRLFDSRLDWGYRTEPQPGLGDRRVYWPRGRMLGGSSSMNAMMWIRGFAADYDAWARACGPQWSYASVLPVFQDIEAAVTDAPDEVGQHGRLGPVALRELVEPNPLTLAWLAASGEAGIGPNTGRNAGTEEGVASPLVTQHDGRRVSAADAYLRPALRRPNLVVRSGVVVDRIEVDGGRAKAVHYRAGRTSQSVHLGREIVLCAGAIGSPEVLLRSGIGPPEMLARAGVGCVAPAPGVGQHLEDHLSTGFALGVDVSVSLGAAQGVAAIASYLLARRGLLTSNVCEGYGYIRSDPDLELCDLELLFVPGLFLDEGLTISRRHGITLAAVLLQPESHGEIRLAPGRKRAELVIDPRYLSDPGGHDAAVLAKGVRTCLRIARSAPLALVTTELVQPPPGPDEEVVERSVRDFAQTLYHPVGTCRMGSDPDAVVDPELRLRAVKAVRVADASVMPRIIRGHTNAATMMIAERCAALLRASDRSGAVP